MIIIKKYFVTYDDSANVFKVDSKDSTRCPDCGYIMSGYDHRKRKMLNSSGEEMTFLIRRLYCPICKRIHAELPECMVPNKHYAADVIISAVNNNLLDCPADDSTIRRWRRK